MIARNLNLMMVLIAIQGAAWGQFIQGNPPRQRISISVGQQLIDKYVYTEFSAKARYKDLTFRISKGAGQRRAFEFLDLAYDAQSDHWGATVSLELESYRAGRIHWEVLLGYEQLVLTDIVSNYNNAALEIEYIKLALSPVWDIPRQKVNDFTRLGMTVTAMTPRTKASYSLFDGEFEYDNISMRNHDVGAFTFNINSSLPWLNFSSLSIDAQVGGMWTNDQLEPLFRIGLNLGLGQ